MDHKTRLKANVIVSVVVTLAFIMTGFTTSVCGGDVLDEGFECDDDVFVSYSFQKSTIESVDVAGVVYDRVFLSDLSSFGNPGEPMIPSAAANILIPYGKNVAEIIVETGMNTKIGNNLNIIPACKAVSISKSRLDENIVIKKDESIYSADKNYPGVSFTKIGTYAFRGYLILVLELFPVQYNPKTGDAFFYEHMDVTVKTIDDKSKNALYRGRDETIREKIDNPEVMDTYPLLTPSLDEDYDLLILTTDQLQYSFIPLKEAHDADGVNTVIRTLTDVGSTSQEDIRIYIRDFYNNYGIEYVLLGGDSDVVPVRKLWTEVNDGAIVDNLPSDVYYACLDGPYNYDGDSKWGEPNDGEDGGDVDLVAEVYVGRACVGSISEVDNFVNKTLTYMSYNKNDEYLRKILMVGEQLDSYTWGGDYMDDLISYAISEDLYDVDKLYEKNGPWSASQLIDKIESNVHMINHLGHAESNSVMKLYNLQVDELENEKLCFVYTQGCNAGAFDQGDCVAEHFTVKTKHAAFAGVFNARYGWYSPGSTNGLSQKYHKSFVYGLYKANQGTIGKANHYSKEFYINNINGNGMRWCFYQTNLFGDPSLGVANTSPEQPEKPYGPNNGIVGFEYSFLSSTTDPEGEQVYYMWDWDDNTSSEWIGPYNSGDIALTNHTWNESGNYNITLKAKDIYECESNWSDPLMISIVDEPIIEIGDISGGLFRVSAVIKNNGCVDAYRINWKINITGGLILLGKETSGIVANILAKDEVTISSGLIIGIGNTVVTVTADIPESSDTKDADARVFLFFIKINPTLRNIEKFNLERYLQK